MKLHWSPRSPYVRKVLIVAHEKGVADRIERVRTHVGLFHVNDAILVDNPVGKVPTLVLENGEALFDLPVICEYLDGLSPANPLLPATGSERIATLLRQATGDGIMDVLNAWRADTMKPDAVPSAALAKASTTKFLNAVDALERGISSSRPVSRRSRRPRDRMRALLRGFPFRGARLAQRPAAPCGLARQDQRAALARRNRFRRWLTAELERALGSLRAGRVSNPS